MANTPPLPDPNSNTTRLDFPPSPIRPLTVDTARLQVVTETPTRKRSLRSVETNSPIASTSTTHVPGISPTVFHPTRPNAPFISNPLDALDSLAVVQEYSLGSDTEDERLHAQLSTSQRRRRSKHSREPLLPIGGPIKKPSTSSPNTPTRSSMPARRSLSIYAPAQLNTVNTPVTPSRMRNSLDKVFKRRLSVESVRRSVSGLGHTPTQESAPRNETPTTEGRLTFDTKSADIEFAPVVAENTRKNAFLGPRSHDSLNHRGCFTPTLPAEGLDLRNVPMTDPDKRPIRKWTRHPSQNRFFFRGRFLTGGDSPWAFIASLTVVSSIAGVYFGTTAVWWWKNETIAVPIVAAYMTLMTISSMLATVRHLEDNIGSAGTDPQPAGVYRPRYSSPWPRFGSPISKCVTIGGCESTTTEGPQGPSRNVRVATITPLVRSMKYLPEPASVSNIVRRAKHTAHPGRVTARW